MSIIFILFLMFWQFLVFMNDYIYKSYDKLQPEEELRGQQCLQWYQIAPWWWKLYEDEYHQAILLGRVSTNNLTRTGINKQPHKDGYQQTTLQGQVTYPEHWFQHCAKWVHSSSYYYVYCLYNFNTTCMLKFKKVIPLK